MSRNFHFAIEKAQETRIGRYGVLNWCFCDIMEHWEVARSKVWLDSENLGKFDVKKLCQLLSEESLLSKVLKIWLHINLYIIISIFWRNEVVSTAKWRPENLSSKPGANSWKFDRIKTWLKEMKFLMVEFANEYNQETQKTLTLNMRTEILNTK